MFRALAGRSLLLVALVYLLLWASFYVSAPTQDPALEAYLQNVPHYNNLPIFNLRESPDAIEYSRKKLPAVWLAQPNVHADEPYQVFKHEQGKRKKAKAASHYDTIGVKQKLAEAGVTGEEYGEAAKLLQHGRPFTGTRMGAYTWPQVWSQPASHSVPLTRDSPEWLAIRSRLQENKRIVFHDQGRNTVLGFRILHDGKVDVAIKSLAHGLRKRAFTESGQQLVESSASGTGARQAIDPITTRIAKILQGHPHQSGSQVLRPASADSPRVFTWEQVWSKAYPIELPPAADSKSWLGISTALWRNEKVAVHDVANKKLFGFKVNENGIVEAPVQHYTGDLIKFTHGLHRRDLASLFESTAPDGTPKPAAISSVDTKLEAHIQGRPHYLGYSVLDDAWEDDRSIGHALEKNHAVWLTKSSFRKDVPLEVELLRTDGRRQQMDSHAVRVRDLLHGAKTTRYHFGDAAGYLQFGQPFKKTGVEPVDWQDVWDSKPINVRPNLEPEGWLQIRDKLQQNRHILLHDEGRNLQLAFRLDKAGQVELLINDLKHGIFKRSEASSAKSGSGTSVDSEVSHGTLVKRAPTSSSSRMDAFLHRLIPAGGQKGNEGDKKLYADLLHYNGDPINADIHSEDLGRKALRNYGNFWVYEKLVWQNHIEGNPFHHRFAGSRAAVTERESEAVFAFVQTAKRFGEVHGEVHGEVAAKLAYGAPFPRSRRTPPASWPRALSFDSTTMDIHEARAKLQQFTRIVLDNPATGSRVGFKLDSEGKVLVHKFSSAARNLLKRMYNVRRGTYDWYAMYHQYVAPSEPLTAEAARQMFAGTIHHKGEPVLYVGEFDNGMLNHAISRYGGAWIALRDGTREPIHVDQRNGRGASEWLDLHYHLGRIAQDRASYGDIPALLMHGKPFAPRPSSRFGGYSRPKFTGTAFKNSHLWDLSQRQDLYGMHKYLDDHNYLKGWYPSTSQVFGLRLNKQGAVEIQHLAVLSRPLRKRSDFSSAEGSSSASRSSGAGHLAKRMQGASHPPEGSYEWYGRTYRYKAPTTPFTVDTRESAGTLSRTIYHKGIPVFLADSLPRSQVDHALTQHESAWISGIDDSNAYHRPFLVSRRNDGFRSSGWDKVVQHLQDAKTDRVEYGDTLMYLKHGQPFAPRQPVEAPSSSRSRFSLSRKPKQKAYEAPTWQEVLDKGAEVDMDRVGLPYLRHHLDQHNFLVASTGNPGKRFGVRLDAAGRVELEDLTSLVRHVHKRAVEENVSSLERSSGSHHLAKRMASNDVQPGTYEWYVKGYQHHPRERSTAEAREQLFADTIFHGRVPVLVAEEVDVAKVDRALTDYGAAWITSRDPKGNLREPFYLTPSSVVRDHGHTNIGRYVRAMDQYGRDYGSVAMLLKYGKPFPPQKPTGFLKSAFSNALRRTEGKGAYDLSTSDPYLARQNLRETKRMTGWSPIAGKLYDIRLLDDGKVAFSEFKSAGGRLHRRMELPPGSSTDPVPRPSTDPMSDPSAIEDYVFREHRDVAAPTLTDVERRKFFAGDLHFGGMPMFWPEKDANVLQKIQQARPHYPGYWIVGRFRSDPNRLTATYKELDPSQRGSRNVAEQDLLEELPKMHEYGDAHGRDAMLLKYGPGFARRKGGGRFGSYKTPQWDEAEARAPKVPANTPISDKWDMLHAHNMLAIEDEGSTIMLALEKSGGVVRLIDPRSVALHKRMESSSDPVEQPSSDPLEDPAAIEHYIYPDLSKAHDRPSHPLTGLDRSRFFAGDIHFNGNPVFFPASDPKVPIKTWRAKADYPGYWIVGSPHGEPGTRTAAFMVGGVRGYGNNEALLEHVAAVEHYGQRHDRDTVLLKYGPSFPERQNPGFRRIYKTPNMQQVLGSAPRLTADYPISQKWEMLHRNNMLVIQDQDKKVMYALDRLGKVVDPVGAEIRLRKRTAPKLPTRTIEYFINRRHSDDNSVVPLSDVERRRYFAGDLHHKGVPMFFPEMDEHVLAKVQQARRNYPGYWIVGSSLHDNIIDSATYVPSDRRLSVSRRGADDVLDEFGAMIRYRHMHGEDAQLLTYGPGFPKRRSKIKTWTDVKKTFPSSAATMSDKWSELYRHGMLKTNGKQGAVGYLLDETGHLSHMRLWILPSKYAVPHL
ncbi:conserved hypothetical protein [Sporisorium reilianum SRZ2]|uniref:Uncharacterized protein n=1 Tax=Sporisorium reilianum (strain SRZ2) TaxID=999809 RepID=E6ZZS3_SPORE|nr:conserved hypothetical protein [Sporisorium reilianum SRZ2]